MQNHTFQQIHYTGENFRSVMKKFNVLNKFQLTQGWFPLLEVDGGAERATRRRATASLALTSGFC